MQSISINQRVMGIKNGQYEINLFIEEYKPFIASCVSSISGRYVRFGEDDELSIALSAFTEAIKSYDGSKGSFLPFAQNVIRRRVIDFYRKESKHSKVISLNALYSEDSGEDNDLSVAESLDNYSREVIGEYRRLELQELEKELSKWDISFFELADASPKQRKTRRMYHDVITFILSNPDMVAQIKHKKCLPVTEIEKGTGLRWKKVERARKYIIAAIIIVTGDYKYIEDYVDWG